MTETLVRLQWTVICRYDDLVPERGACALVEGRQVAVFRLHDGAVHAVSNYDPFGRAHVLSRGIVGSRGSVPTVASPLFKNAFDLRTGRSLDDETVGIAVYPVRVVDGAVQVRLP